jgi:hypothetical protein
MAAVRRRVRRLLVLDAAGRMLAALAGAALVLCLADYLFRYQERGLRLMSSAALAAVIGWTFYRFLWPAMKAELGDVKLALRLESRLPILHDRLASAVRFVRQQEDDVLAGSTAMRRSVVAEATAELDRLSLEDAVQPDLARRSLGLAAASAVVALAVAFFDLPAAGTALLRLAAPWGNTQWPRQSHLAFVTPARRLAAGQTFEVELKDALGARLPEDVFIQYRPRDSSAAAESSERMRLLNDVMVASRENVVQPFSYRAVGGDDFSMDWIDLDVVEPPTIEDLAVRLRFPEYTGWPPEAAQPHLRALVGTRVELQGRTNKPVRAARVHVDERQAIEARVSEDGRHFSVPGQSDIASAPEKGASEEEHSEALASKDTAAPSGSSPSGASEGDALDFTVQRSGMYWIELVDLEGFSSGDQVRYEIRAIEDFTPTVNIEQPQASVFVTPQASVPLRVAAKDDLALARVALRFSRSDQSQQDEIEIVLYQGPEHSPVPVQGSASPEGGDARVVTREFDVAALAANPGTQFTLFATASDFFPHLGQSQPVRLTVVTADELRERLVERQNYIVGELFRLLKLQRDARSPLGAAEIQLQQVGRLKRHDVDHLQSPDMLQRQVERGLVSPGEGVAGQIASLLADLAQNKVDSPDVERQMRSLLEEIDRLGRDELPAIGGELTAAIKAAQVELLSGEAEEAPPGRKSAAAVPLVSAGRHQDEVIQTLERLTASLAEWEKYRRFHGEIATLRRQQVELHRESVETGRQTLTRDLNKLTGQEQADLAKLAERQLELARQFDKIQQRMQRAADESANNPLEAGSLADALSYSRQRGISQAMHESGSRIERNQFGQATQGQRRADDDLQEVLDILLNRREHELSRLVKKLRDAQEQLAELRQQQEGLRKKLEAAAAEGGEAARRRELQRLTRRQQETAAATERLARSLERLQAERAGRKTSQGGANMNRAQERAEQGDAQAAAEAAGEAERDLDQAQQELAERLAQAEADLAEEQMARLEDHIKALVVSEEKLLDDTRHYADVERSQGRLHRTQEISVGDLGKRQHEVEQETTALAARLAGTPVYRAAFEHAAQRMQHAAGLLEQHQVGEPTQQAEERAFDLLTHALEALKPAAEGQPPDGEEEEQQGAGEQGQNANAADAAQTLADLKLLKWMQDDVNERTKALDDEYGKGADLPADARREYEELSREQGVIAALTLKLAKSNAPDADQHDESVEGDRSEQGGLDKPNE